MQSIRDRQICEWLKKQANADSSQKDLTYPYIRSSLQ